MAVKQNNTKGDFFLFFYKTSNYFTKSKKRKIIGLPVRVVYKVLIQWVLGIDIPDQTTIGENFNLFHGQGVVINENTIIGDNVIIRQNTTIGNARLGGPSPIIGDGVDIGANSVVIGKITIGSNSIVAAGSIVVKDVPSHVLVAGNPAKIIKKIYE